MTTFTLTELQSSYRRKGNPYSEEQIKSTQSHFKVNYAYFPMIAFLIDYFKENSVISLKLVGEKMEIKRTTEGYQINDIPVTFKKKEPPSERVTLLCQNEGYDPVPIVFPSQKEADKLKEPQLKEPQLKESKLREAAPKKKQILERSNSKKNIFKLNTLLASIKDRNVNVSVLSEDEVKAACQQLRLKQDTDSLTWFSELVQKAGIKLA